MATTKAAIASCIEEILVDAYGDDEQLTAFASKIDELLTAPVRATVMGEPVELLSVDNVGRFLGIRARLRRGDQEHEMALCDVILSSGAYPELLLTMAAYRQWIRDNA